MDKLKWKFISAIILLFFVHNLFAQNTAIDLSLRNVTLKQFIAAVEEKTEYTFMLDNTIDQTQLVTVEVKQENIQTILRKALGTQKYTYEIAGKQIILKPKNATASATPKKITGKVTDEHGEPVIGANIAVKGLAVGTVTGFEGEFTLDVPEHGTLHISYIGYRSLDLPITNKTTLNIRLQEDTEQLNEVVVIGYGTQKKVNLTGSVTSVKMDEVLGNRPVTSLPGALMGNVPGLILSGNSGEPGAGYNLKVRGTSSINGGDPLILVDNVPMNISDINPEDIESVSVLKDASAAAVYGARAAFGVILVTTKKSQKEQKNRFSYSAKLSLSQPQELPRRATPFQTITAAKDAGYVTMWTAQDVDTWLDLLNQYNTTPSLYPDGYAMVDGTRYSLRETDLTRDMMENFGTQQIHDFSVSGGSEKSAYRISLGVLDEDGILRTGKDSYSRYNISSFLSMDVAKWMTAQLSILYSRSKKSDPYNLKFNGKDVWSQSVYAPSFYPTDGMEIDGVYSPFVTPRHILEVAVPDKQKVNRLNVLGRIILSPVKGLTVTGEYSINHTFESVTNYQKHIPNFADGMAFNSMPSSVTQSTYKETKKKTEYNALNIFTTYNAKIKDHDFTLTGGINSEYSNYENLWASRVQMINDELPSIGQGVGLTTAGDDFSEYAIFGLFYRANYSYKNKYLFEASGRYDGSSKFPENNRFGFFPSFSAGWRISEEPFMKEWGSILSNLKIRASWGSIGNQNIDPYSYTPGMESFLADWIVNGQKATTLKSPALVRSNFTWEEVRTTNGGIDIGLLEGKFNGSFDLFRRETLRMLGPGADYPAVVGAAAPLQNSANMLTKGWELQLSWHDKIGNVAYNIGFNISDYKSKITKFKNDTKILTDHYEGETLGEIWGYVTDRYYTEDDFVEGTLKTTAAGELTGGTLKPGIPKVKGYSPNPGDILYKYPDENGDIWSSSNTYDDPGSKRIIGNSSFRYVYGIQASAEWKGFSLSLLLQGVGKRQVWLKNSAVMPYTTNWYIGLNDYQLDYWTPRNTDAFYPRLYQSAGYNTAANSQVQTKYLLDASYLDIKSIVLSYDLSRAIISKARLDNVTFFVNGENLWSFNHFPKGLHPDSKTRAEGAIYPVMRMFTAGLNIAF